MFKINKVEIKKVKRKLCCMLVCNVIYWMNIKRRYISILKLYKVKMFLVVKIDNYFYWGENDCLLVIL